PAHALVGSRARSGSSFASGMRARACRFGDAGDGSRSPTAGAPDAPTAPPRRTCTGGSTPTSDSLVEFTGEICPARAGGGFLARLRVARERRAHHERARFAHHADVVDFPNTAPPLHVDHRIEARLGLQFHRSGFHVRERPECDEAGGYVFGGVRVDRCPPAVVPRVEP